MIIPQNFWRIWFQKEKLWQHFENTFTQNNGGMYVEANSFSLQLNFQHFCFFWLKEIIRATFDNCWFTSFHNTTHQAHFTCEESYFVKHIIKFSSVFGGHLIFMNIVSLKKRHLVLPIGILPLLRCL